MTRYSSQNIQKRATLNRGIILVEDFYELRRHVSQVIFEKNHRVEFLGGSSQQDVLLHRIIHFK